VIKRAWRNFVAVGMFATRMAAFGMMLVLQRTVGGAEIKTPNK
jgi:hypothetical protein